MKKQYIKKQIVEAIEYWKKLLDSMDDSQDAIALYHDKYLDVGKFIDGAVYERIHRYYSIVNQEAGKEVYSHVLKSRVYLDAITGLADLIQSLQQQDVNDSDKEVASQIAKICEQYFLGK